MNSGNDIKTVLARFGLRHAEVKSPETNESQLLKVSSESGPYCLKFLGEEYTAAHVHSLLQFLDFLSEGGLPVAEAQTAVDGKRYVAVSSRRKIRFALLFKWIDGEDLGERTGGDWIERSGQLLARLHCRSREFQPSEEFSARAWDEVYTTGQHGWLGDFLKDSPVDQAFQNVIVQAVNRTGEIRRRLPKINETYGIIHADFHGDNLIFDGTEIHIIDVVDFGWGDYLSDLTWPAALFAKHHPDHDAAASFLEPFLRGYESVRPLTGPERKLLPEFLLAAGIAVVEMVHTSSVPNDSPLAQEWYGFAVNWFARYLEG